MEVSSFLAPLPVNAPLAENLRWMADRRPDLAGIHLSGTTAAIVCPAALQEVPGGIVPRAGYEVVEDDGEQFALLSRTEAMARLAPGWRPKRVALATHVLARNGAPLALLSAAKCLRKHGYELHVYSRTYDPLAQEFAELGIPVTVQEDLLRHAWTDLPWYEDYDMVLANTVLFASCFCKPLGEVPVLWWLHEGASSLRWIGFTEEDMKQMLKSSSHVTTVGVSDVANQAFHALAPAWPIDGVLTLGMKDFCGRRARREKSLDAPCVFLVVGAVEPRKGQDTLCEAFLRLTPEERRRCEIRVIGAWPKTAPKAWEEALKRRMAACPEIKKLGILPHEEILKMYAEADAVIVPSREETLSMVAIEGMAASLPCIISDGVGAVRFAEPGQSVLTFPAGDAGSLAEQMRFLLHHPQEAAAIGRAGRAVYETSFRPAHFEERLLQLVEQRIAHHAVQPSREKCMALAEGSVSMRTSAGMDAIRQKMMEIYRRDVERKNIITRDIVRELEPLFQAHGYRTHAKGAPLRILLLHDTGVGDFINCSPAIREVRKAYPQAYITLVVFSRSQDMAVTCPYVDQVLTDPRRCDWSDPMALFRCHIEFAQKLLPMHFDFCFDFISYGSSVLLSYLCGATHRIGYAAGRFRSDGPFPQETVSLFLTEHVPFGMRGTHDVFYYLALVEHMTHHAAEDCHPEVWTLSQETRRWQGALQGRWMAIVMGGTEERRHWPVESYAALLRQIAEEEKGLRFLILGGPQDRADGEWLAKAIPDGMAWDLAGRLGYRESVAALGCCLGYLGNDTGTLHAAAALHLPVLTPNCYPADLPMAATAVPRKFYPFGVPAVMVLPAHALPECRTSADPWGCAQAHRAHCICQISVPLMMEGYHFLKKLVLEKKKQTFLLYEREDSAHGGSVMVAQPIECLYT